MKFLVVAVVTAGLAVAQSIEDYFPECSIDCLSESVPLASDCTVEDAVCICVRANYEAIVGHSTNCVMQACGPDVAVGEVLPAAGAYCLAASASASGGVPSTTEGPTSATASPEATATGSEAPEETADDAGDEEETPTENPSSTATPDGVGALAVPSLFGMLALGAVAWL